jgi:hypothetical protein
MDTVALCMRGFLKGMSTNFEREKGPRDSRRPSVLPPFPNSQTGSAKGRTGHLQIPRVPEYYTLQI